MRKKLLSFIACLLFLGGVFSCCADDASRKEKIANRNIIEETKIERNPHLFEIDAKKVDVGFSYSYVSTLKFEDDGCTYYIVNSFTGASNGGVSTDIIHSASCKNPIHKNKEDHDTVE